jgi:hypothetical protein
MKNPGLDIKNAIEEALIEQNNGESHVENDCYTFHPSQLAGDCKRQILLSKFGIENHGIDDLGRFRIGTLVHEWLENHLPEIIRNDRYSVIMEKPVDYHAGKIHITGSVDCVIYDNKEKTKSIIDFKTQNGWYYFDPWDFEGKFTEHKDYHLDQIVIYSVMLDADFCKLVYINKGDFEVKPWPKNTWFNPIYTRFANLLKTAEYLSNWLEEFESDKGRLPESKEDIPFEKCGDCIGCKFES